MASVFTHRLCGVTCLGIREFVRGELCGSTLNVLDRFWFHVSRDDIRISSI